MEASVDRYYINLDLTGESDEYPGSVQIDFLDANGKIELDAKDMKIDSVAIDGSPTPFSYDQNQWKVGIENPPKGKSSVLVKFTGKISSGLHGLYHAGSGDQEMLSTDFEPNSARHMIPCIDHPGFKAVFSLKVRIKPGLEAISNMPVKEEKSFETFKEVEFQDTPRMSTYLLYLGVGKFAKRSKMYGSVEVILAAPGKELKSDDYPLDTAIKCLEFFDKYFGIKYVLPKMHLIAVPEFASGAMENWGAITFREESLLTSESTDAASRMWIATAIVHEIAHQWFGNLVTMKWWNDIWLNESFATFMSYLNIDSIYPEYEIWKMFYRHESLWAMNEDSLRSSHPIDVKVHSPDEIQQIFDGVSYGKGGSILRMMEKFVGREDFRKGTAQYLTDFSYGNAEGMDFWQHIEKASDQPVVKVALDWIRKQGFPAIYVRRDGNDLVLHQERFLLDGSRTDEIWPVPIVIKRKGQEERTLLEIREIKISAKDFIKINSDGSGFFITRYDDEYYNEIGNVLDSFSDIDVAEIENDAHYFYERGELSTDTYFRLIEALTQKPVLPAVNIISSHLDLFSLLIPENTKFVDRSVQVLRKLNKLLGEKTVGEAVPITVARSVVREIFARLDPEFARSISPEFDRYFSLDPDERLAVAIARSHFETTIDPYRSLIMQASSDEDRNKLIRGMAMVKGDENYRRIFEMIDAGEIKKQDAITAYGAIIRNPDARKFLVDHLEENIGMLRSLYEGTPYTSMALQGGLPVIGLDNIDKIKTKIEKIKGPDVAMGIAKGMENLEIHQTFRDKHLS